jgi:hypothetical protein
MGRLVSISKVISTAGVAERLTATSTLAKWVDIQADFSNTDSVFIGGVHVDGSLTPAVGIEIFAGTTYSLQKLLQKDGPIDLKDIWLDVSVSGEGIGVNYWSVP